MYEYSRRHVWKAVRHIWKAWIGKDSFGAEQEDAIYMIIAMDTPIVDIEDQLLSVQVMACAITSETITALGEPIAHHSVGLFFIYFSKLTAEAFLLDAFGINPYIRGSPNRK